MLKVNSNIKLNLPKLKQLDRASARALEQTVEALKTEVTNAGVMPKDIGTLQDTNTWCDASESSKGKVSLISNGPYARRLYFHPEYNFQTKENANARGKWLDDWIDGKEKDFCKNTFEKLYKKESGV